MRGTPTILHLDMDAFYASAEQAAKPSLRGKPVVVGGLGPRGVVATASYEARVFGVHSAMAMAQARRLCPNAAFLTPRFTLYRQVSDQVMALLHTLSPLVEPLSLDEAFVDLEAGGTEPTAKAARAVGERLRTDIRAVTGLTGSVGLAGSKMLAKIASEQAKPDGLTVIEPGTERDLLGPMSVRTLPGVGPATAEALRRAGIHTVAETREAGEAELVRLLGRAHGASLFLMANGRDERPVVAERDAKSISVEDTFDVDLTDRTRVQLEIARLADRCVRRLREAGRSGRTVVIKVRRYDFSTLTRSETLRGPTDDPGVVREAAARLIDGVDTTAGVRLLGVGVSGLADYTQEDLFAQAAQAAQAAHEALEDARRGPGPEIPEPVEAGAGEAHEGAGKPRRWLPGSDVRHAEYGAGWVQGSGVGRVTVRFEEPWSRPGRVRTFAVDDPALEPADPLPLQHPAEAAVGPDEIAGRGGSVDAAEGVGRGGTLGPAEVAGRDGVGEAADAAGREEVPDRGGSVDAAEVAGREEAVGFGSGGLDQGMGPVGSAELGEAAGRGRGVGPGGSGPVGSVGPDEVAGWGRGGTLGPAEVVGRGKPADPGKAAGRDETAGSGAGGPAGSVGPDEVAGRGGGVSGLGHGGAGSAGPGPVAGAGEGGVSR
ncbi:DNA polymerase IV [Streptomyces sp. S465]|uniref:DNA polymerase IV n=1 Tax=Streptomyces sp. S465 TaxID=2979468 RepID=UPI0022A81E89|nr:DNA polymerase IV [Streptomyces sp. S465]WAP54594.1 DNA polymerase IV [Streptomyces sp. S465]